MYNDLIEIVFCVFSVYGIYCALREIAMLFPRKDRFYAAAYIGRDSDVQEQDDTVILAEHFVQKHRSAARRPVILIEDRADLARVSRYGYDVYIRCTETEEECRKE